MKARKTWLVWTFLALPPVTLGLLIGVFMAVAGIGPADPGAETMVRRALPYVLAVNHMGLFALLVLFLRRYGEGLRDIGWSAQAVESTIAREVGIGIVSALGLYLFKELAIDSVRALLSGRTPTFTTLFNFQPARLDVPLALAATTLVFVEESIYRGFALPPLAKRRGTIGAIVITSIAFGFLHWGNGVEAILFTAVIGALLATIYVWRRNLVAGTVAHALYNLAVLLT